MIFVTSAVDQYMNETSNVYNDGRQEKRLKE